VNRVVRGDLIDANGHMSVMHYLDFGSSAPDALLHRLGIDDD
jgi:acyl-CoA thioester hydrolase